MTTFRPLPPIPPELLTFNLADWPAESGSAFDGYGAIWTEMRARDRQQRARDAWCLQHGVSAAEFQRLAAQQRPQASEDTT
jgi:hypothetical protein